jgi:hypothetical protein
MIGNFFANCFIHFEPYEPIDGESLYDPEADIPPYLVTGSAWEMNWKADNPGGWKGVSFFRGFVNFFDRRTKGYIFSTICRFLQTELDGRS